MMIDKRLIGFAQGSMKYVGFNVLAQWVSLVCNIAIIFAVGFAVESLVAGVLPSFEIILIAAAGILVRFLCTIAATKASFLSADAVKLTLRETIYKKVLALGGSYHQSAGTAEVIQVASEGVDQLETYFSKYLPQLAYSLLAPITLFVVLSFVSLPAALALIICVPLIPFSIVMVQRIAKKLLKEYWGTYTDLGAGFLENIQALTTLKIYQADAHKNNEMNAQAESFRRITMRVLRMQLNSITVMDLIAYGGSAVGIIVAVFGFAGDSIGLAGTLAIILLASEFFLPLRLLGSFFHIAMNGMAASDKIFKLLDLPDAQQDSIDGAPFAGEIRLEAVSFAYDEQRPLLHEIDLTIKPGITALVGESGSGKSTVAGLIAGTLKDYAGAIAVGGNPLTSYSDAWLAETITYVGHNSYLFSGTVRQNLLMGDAAASDEALWDILEQVNLADFLREQEGLETHLNEAGANFSGGQRQRLALARALLHDSPCYIFDEATSNIDVESENDITAIIWALAQTKTVLLISHRLANVTPANTIYVMDNGRIVEHGNHEILLAQQGTYAEMFLHQAELERIARKEAVSA